MASSDDEADYGPTSVSNYYFEDEADQPVPFSVLPIQWSEDESPIGAKKRISLRGTADKGLQTIHKDVTAWKFDLTNAIPVISVLSKEKKWIKLLKPRKSFEQTIRTILIVVHCLSYAKRFPEMSGKSLWEHLSRTFSLHEVRPSQNDLVDHIDLITEALKRDAILAKSKFLAAFLEAKPRKKKLSDEDVQTTVMSGFIVDDTEDVMNDVADEDKSNEVDDCFDSTCAFCDNGGNLLCCEGRCMRSFHPSEEDSEECQTECQTLGLTKEEVDAIHNFLCKNCEYKQHQCYACGKLGSSDKDKGAEVFSCVSATCGHFYHPFCVSKLLFRDDEAAAEKLEKSIVEGGSFTCPLHKCYVCKGGEDKMKHELQFAVCRRCPKAYHRKCLPRKIVFEDSETKDLPARAWEGLLPNRILIYCLKHEIIDELGTPSRDHIKFPCTEEDETVVEGFKRKQKPELPARKEKVESTKSSLTSKGFAQGKSATKRLARLPSAMKQGKTLKKIEKSSVVSDSKWKVKAAEASKNSLKKNLKSVSAGVDRPSMDDANEISLGERLFAYAQEAELTKLGKRDTPESELNKTATVTPARKKLSTELPSLDTDAKRSLLSLMQDATSSITLEAIQKKHRMPSTHAYSSKTHVDRTITLGRVEGSVEAVQTALKKLEEEKGDIEDAKAVCQPEVLDQLFKWKNKLKVYLAPFLYGMRYTSFGRHFTKIEKLQDIADRLQWYTQDGDMIVDFCCGANDFSCLMKKKLEATGKKCLFKNYDIIPAKNDFNFEKRDWLTVRPGELAPGSQLIMGLNPPFGVKAALANMFINKALEFKPKLLILIVPPETERLDRKKSPYDLVWEDEQFLSGKSFYLPGSIDENDKQLDDWNLVSPPLSLWSRRDWTDKHKAIAEKYGHISREQKGSNLEKISNATDIIDQIMEDDFGHCGDTSMLADHHLQNKEDDKLIQKKIKSRKESCPDSGSEGHSYRKNHSSKDSWKRNFSNENCGSEISGKSPVDEQSRGRHPGSEVCNAMPHHSPAKVIDGRSSAESGPSRSVEMPSKTGFADNNNSHFGPGMSGSHVKLGTALGETHSSSPVDMEWENGTSEKLPVEEQSGGRNPRIETYLGKPRHSPANVIDSRISAEVRGSRSIEMPTHAGLVENGYQHFEPSMAGSHRTTAYGGTRASMSDEIERSFSMNNSELYSSHRFSGGVNLGEPFMGRGRDNADNNGYRSYMSDIERESDVRSQLGYYGQDVMGSDPVFSQLGSLPSRAPASYRTNTSVMQRYVMELDQFNPTMTSGFRFEQPPPPPPPMGGINDFYDLRAPMNGYQADPFANTPAPNYPYPYRPGSGGWLND